MQIRSILTQSLRGLASLHASPEPVIHRDIKPENILVADYDRCVAPHESGPWVKLADFGLAREGTTCRGSAGTWLYTAPEVFYKGGYNSKVDVWSLGVVIMQLLLQGNLPEPKKGYTQGPDWCNDVINLAMRNHDFLFRLDHSSMNEIHFSMITLLWGFISGFMLVWDPDSRLSAQQCLDHPYFLFIQESNPVPGGQRVGTGQTPNKSSPGTRGPANHQNTLPATYDPGVEEAVALEDRSRTAGTSGRPQPLSYGLLFDDASNSTSEDEPRASIE